MGKAHIKAPPSSKNQLVSSLLLPETKTPASAGVSEQG
jgi:hypothetical protein